MDSIRALLCETPCNSMVNSSLWKYYFSFSLKKAIVLDQASLAAASL
jgi:hypothetical protein